MLVLLLMGSLLFLNPHTHTQTVWQLVAVLMRLPAPQPPCLRTEPNPLLSAVNTTQARLIPSQANYIMKLIFCIDRVSWPGVTRWLSTHYNHISSDLWLSVVWFIEIPRWIIPQRSDDGVTSSFRWYCLAGTLCGSVFVPRASFSMDSSTGLDWFYLFISAPRCFYVRHEQ